MILLKKIYFRVDIKKQILLGIDYGRGFSHWITFSVICFNFVFGIPRYK